MDVASAQARSQSSSARRPRSAPGQAIHRRHPQRPRRPSRSRRNPRSSCERGTAGSREQGQSPIQGRRGSRPGTLATAASHSCLRSAHILLLGSHAQRPHVVASHSARWRHSFASISSRVAPSARIPCRFATSFAQPLSGDGGPASKPRPPSPPRVGVSRAIRMPTTTITALHRRVLMSLRSSLHLRTAGTSRDISCLAA